MTTSELDDGGYADRTWQSADGLTLHYREYPGDAAAVPIICLPGLTRNARDFSDLAADLAGPRRILCVEFRGRGESDYARDTASYTPATYAEDVLALLDEAQVSRFAAIGTSLGGMVTALVAAARPDALAGAVLNDIGPEVESAGLDRIQEYVGAGGSFPTWMHAARHLRELHGDAHPMWEAEEWLAYAKRVMTLTGNGRIAYDYDMKIAEPFREPSGAVPPDLWPAFEALGGRPLLVLRGAQSDLLSPATVDAMQARMPGLETAEVPGVGHAPSLNEPEARAAIARWLDRLT